MERDIWIDNRPTRFTREISCQPRRSIRLNFKHLMPLRPNIEQRRPKIITAVTWLVLVNFVFTSFFPSSGFAQTLLNLPIPGTMVKPTPGFIPTLVRGIKVYPENPFRFDFIVDPGDSKLQGEELKKESDRLIKYFLASLTVPENDLWVNLSPYEKERIIPEKFGTTEMGKDLLAQDYLLKQLTASLMYPEDELGKEFWNRVYKKAHELYGTTNIPINTFNKVWIMPDKAVVYENKDVAFVVESHLKVMLEGDYLALQNNLHKKEIGTDTLQEPDVKQLSDVSSQIVKDVILPEIEKEVNEGKNFANLRQIQNSLILATWYKKRLKESILGKVYVDKNKISGVNVDDSQVREKIYDQYVEAFKQGVYDYIKKEKDSYLDKTVSRRYVSGGYTGVELDDRMEFIGPNQSIFSSFLQGLRRTVGTMLIGVSLFVATPTFAQDKTVILPAHSFEGQEGSKSKINQEWWKGTAKAIENYVKKNYIKGVHYNLILKNNPQVVIFGDSHRVNSIRTELKRQLSFFIAAGYKVLALEAIPSSLQDDLGDFLKGKNDGRKIKEHLYFRGEGYLELILEAHKLGMEIVGIDHPLTENVHNVDLAKTLNLRNEHWVDRISSIKKKTLLLEGRFILENIVQQ